MTAISDQAGLAPSGHADSFARDHLPPPELWPRMDLGGAPGLDYPARLNLAAVLLDDMVAAGHGGRPVVAAAGVRWTYAELLDKANRIAAVLRHDMGLVPGNRVLLRGPNDPMTFACWFGVLKAGGVLVATMPLLRRRELAYIADRAEVDFALCASGLAEELEAVTEARPLTTRFFNAEGGRSLEAAMASQSGDFDNADTAADDVALIAFTSGTTGQAKGCMHFHRDPLASADTFGKLVLESAPDDIVAGTPPLAFTFGMGGLLVFPMRVGASVALLDNNQPDAVLQAVRDYRVTTLYTAPTAYRVMAGMVADYDISSLTKCVSAGETLPRSNFEAWRQATGLKIIDGIGATEMFHIFIACAGDAIRPGATGRPIPGYEAAVLDDDGQPVTAGEIGQLAVRGPTGCRYLDDPARQAVYVRDGWNFTGDAYRQDEDGYFWYHARSDDMIISAGYNISGAEIEAVLMEHQKVLECAVVGVPDPARGQIVKAFVVLRDPDQAGATLVKEIQDFVKAEMAPYKYPRAVEFIAQLPRTGTGKVQRFRLRDDDAAKQGGQ